MRKIDFTAGDNHAGLRLDRCLAELMTDYSRTMLANLIKDGQVRVDGTVVDAPRFAVRSGMLLQIELPEAKTETISPEPFAFDILFEDSQMLVINKPAGVVVHPAAGNPDGTVVNALLGRYPDMAERFSGVDARPGIVHRLDKDTSGCLAIAKTPEALFKLGAAFANRDTAKTYLAICRGMPQQQSGELKTLIGRHPVNRQKMAIVERNGKEAHTKYRIVAQKLVNDIPLSLVKVQIFTGRTHQIRVHLASAGLPIIGDTLYGNRNTVFPGVTRQMLHAWKLSLPHPGDGKTVHFTAPIPEDIAALQTLIES